MTEDQKPKEKTEAEITNQVGRITAKLIARAEKLQPPTEVPGSSWKTGSEIRTSSSTINTLREPSRMKKSIEIERQTADGIVQRSSASTSYVHYDPRLTGYKEKGSYGPPQFFKNVDVKSEDDSDANVHRSYEFHPEDDSASTHLVVKAANGAIYNGEWNQNADEYTKAAAISTSAQTLGKIRSDIVAAERQQQEVKHQTPEAA